MASKLKVGDLVEYAEAQSNWQGGKGKVTAINELLHYAVEVECLVVPEMIAEVAEGDPAGFIGRVGNFAEDSLIPLPSTQPEMVEHPPHYGGKDDPYEVIKVAEAWGLDKDAYLFNVLKYIARCAKKGALLEDLRKGHFYLGRKITNLVKETAK